MFGCKDCDVKYKMRAGNFDIVPNMKSGFSNRCKSCRIEWHNKYRTAVHSKDTIDKIAVEIIKITSRTLSDENAEKLMNAANNMRARNRIVESLTLTDMKTFIRQKNYEKRK